MTATTNLATQYGAPEMAWEAVRDRLNAGFEQAPGDDSGPGRHTCWLTTINPDGSPHVTALGALWAHGTFWFETSARSRKGRNIARDARCSLAIALHEFDLVIEGDAEQISDPATVADMAARWAAEGWPAEVDDSGTALTAPYSAQSAGKPPWHVYRINTRSAYALQTVEPYGATRWRF